MRADHGVGSGTQRGGREGALARVLARRPLEAQWKLAMTTSPLRRARRTPASIRTGVAGWVPALSGPAKNELGRMSEKPTNAILRPSRSTTLRARRGREVRARSDGRHAEAAHVAHGVEQGGGAAVAGVVVGEV
jgi:hypothetical protein